jgi:multidrug efflux pump subunit AcrA (membrane-fusion protein)
MPDSQRPERQWQEALTRLRRAEARVRAAQAEVGREHLGELEAAAREGDYERVRNLLDRPRQAQQELEMALAEWRDATDASNWDLSSSEES